MTEGKTTAPQPLSESDLITQMDANGIGTDVGSELFYRLFCATKVLFN
jgi:hypothetical protein